MLYLQRRLSLVLAQFYLMLQHINMVEIDSRPQTITCFDMPSLLVTVTLDKIGSENYSGTKIPWAEGPVRVRVSSAVLMII